MDYRIIADGLAADIAEGRLSPGERLPPQRHFAFQRGIAPSTAARAYAELRRRGLVIGEVGRGTYVRLGSSPAGAGFGEPPAAGLIDLELVVPVLPEQPAMLAAALAALAGSIEALRTALDPVASAADPAKRDAAAAALARPGWAPDPAGIRFAGNGRQGLAGALATLASAGARVGFEALTYPAAKAVAARLGLVPVPIALDEHGMRPDALDEACRGGLAAVYVQPTLQNPLGPTMPEKRRGEIAAALRRHDVVAVEDAVYAFLDAHAPPPLAAFAPERVIHVDSLSKRIGPGCTLGILSAPPGPLAEQLGRALRTGAWGATGLPLEIGLSLMANGTAARLETAKRADAARRQAIVAEALGRLRIRRGPGGYHLWMELPGGWRAESFAGAALRRGVVVTPAAAFTIGAAHAPPAVRVALASPPLDQLRQGLAILAQLAEAGPGGEALD
ncbi:aminotransferase-like domain-containing protein [Paracraurococcus lichenis]|uniref:PLP-dependent aminotransferase family protein n=1 Tax=Paracraurococcus lichenis TaxID=3064888 RepID=A0ABT9EB18_9PROT|nr:PLP-dependent aminotransferase family protein [Paracraurococcus sp. LOR1-02]MDO9713225.1 PLP-dependent aminotransferase family protein [Paracraurococcus sp. LOR1-02]